MVRKGLLEVTRNLVLWDGREPDNEWKVEEWHMQRPRGMLGVFEKQGGQSGCRRRARGRVMRAEGSRVQAHRTVIKNPVLQQENNLPFIS